MSFINFKTFKDLIESFKFRYLDGELILNTVFNGNSSLIFRTSRVTIKFYWDDNYFQYKNLIFISLPGLEERIWVVKYE